MRTQKVSVNVWQMLISSCSYLVLAFVAWVFLRLVQACFWFPSYLRKVEIEPKDSEQLKDEEDKEQVQDKKKD